MKTFNPIHTNNYYVALNDLLSRLSEEDRKDFHVVLVATDEHEQTVFRHLSGYATSYADRYLVFKDVSNFLNFLSRLHFGDEELWSVFEFASAKRILIGCFARWGIVLS